MGNWKIVNRAKCVVRKILIPTMEGTFCFRPPTPLELPFKGILAYPSPPGMTKHLISMRKIFFLKLFIHDKKVSNNVKDVLS